MPVSSFPNSIIVRDCLHAECSQLASSPEAIERHLRLHGSATSARHNHDSLVFKPLKLCVQRGGQLASLPSSRNPSARLPNGCTGQSPQEQKICGNRAKTQSILNIHDVLRFQHSQFLTSRRPTASLYKPNATLFNSVSALAHANPALCISHVLPPPKREALPPPGKLDSNQTDPEPELVDNVLGETMPIHRYLRVRRKHKRRLPGDDDGAAAARRLVSRLKKSTGLVSKIPKTPTAFTNDEPILTLNLDLELLVPDSLGSVNFPSGKANINPTLRPTSTKARIGSSRPTTATSRSSGRSARDDTSSSRASDLNDDWDTPDQLMLDEEEDLGNILAPMLLNRGSTAPGSKPMTAGSTGGGVTAAVWDVFPNGDSEEPSTSPAMAAAPGSPQTTPSGPHSAAAGGPVQQAQGNSPGPPVMDRAAMALSFLTNTPGRTTADPRVLAVLDVDRESTIAGLLELQASHTDEMATSETDDETLFAFMNDVVVLLMMQRVRATGAVSVQYDAQIQEVLADPLASSIRMTWTTCEYLRVVHAGPLFPSTVFSQLVSLVNDATLDDRAKRKRARLLCRRHVRKLSPNPSLLFRSVLGHLGRILVLAEVLPRRDPHRKLLQYRLAIGLIPAIVQEGWTEDLPAHMRIVRVPTVTTSRRGRRRTRSGSPSHRPQSGSPPTTNESRNRSLGNRELLGPATAFWRDHLRRDLRLLPQPDPDAFAHAVLEGFPVPERSILQLNDVDDGEQASTATQDESTDAKAGTLEFPPVRNTGTSTSDSRRPSMAASPTTTAAGATAMRPASTNSDSTIRLARAPSPPVGTPLALHSRPVSAAIIDARVARHRKQLAAGSPASDTPLPLDGKTTPVATVPVRPPSSGGGLAQHLRRRPHTAAALGPTHANMHDSGVRTNSAGQRVKWAPPTSAPHPVRIGSPVPLKPRAARVTSPLQAKPLSPWSPPPTAGGAPTDTGDNSDGELTSQRLLFDQLTLPVDTVDLAARALVWFFANADIVLDLALVRAVRLDRELKQAQQQVAQGQSSAPAAGSNQDTCVGRSGPDVASAPPGATRVLGMGRRGSVAPSQLVGASSTTQPGSAPAAAAAKRIQSGKASGPAGNRKGTAK